MPEGYYRHVLETLDGEPVFCSTFDRPKSEVPAKRIVNGMTKKFERPNVRLFRETAEGEFRIGWKTSLGVGYRFLAVDWSQKAPRVVVTRNPGEAAVWHSSIQPLPGCHGKKDSTIVSFTLAN